MFVAYTQKLQVGENKIDATLKRQGAWIIFMDGQWQPPDDSMKAAYYRAIHYVEEKPAGLVTDYYRNGLPNIRASWLRTGWKTFRREIKRGIIGRASHGYSKVTIQANPSLNASCCDRDRWWMPTGLHDIMPIVGVLTALSANSFLTRPRFMVVFEWPSLINPSPDVNCHHGHLG